jgi:hypothetical protein
MIGEYTPVCSRQIRSAQKILRPAILYIIKIFIMIIDLDPGRAPALPGIRMQRPIARNSALLILPFYAKSRYGSLGKHVLTPALTLSAIAAGTPDGWQIRL